MWPWSLCRLSLHRSAARFMYEFSGNVGCELICEHSEFCLACLLFVTPLVLIGQVCFASAGYELQARGK